MMSPAKKLIIKFTVFCLITAVCLYALNSLCKPVWKEWNNFNTTRGFYKVPKNTVDVVILGSSVSMNGISPMVMYKNNGVAAYNLSTEQQPVLGSYYWLKEAYRLHPKSLKTVIFEVQLMTRRAKDAFYRKAIDPMHLSSVKFDAIRHFLKENEPEMAFSYLFPLYKYHDRWKDLDVKDFGKSSMKPEVFRLGYNFVKKRLFYLRSAKELPLLPGTRVLEDSSIVFDAENIHFFHKIAEFCKEKGINLILAKTPTEWWRTEHHKAIEELADQYQLPFIDFCEPALYRQLDYIFALDSADQHSHMNFWGAEKLSKWLGNYLLQNHYAEDRRKNTKYHYFGKLVDLYDKFIKKELNSYNKADDEPVDLRHITDFSEMLEKMLRMKGTVSIISLRDEGVKAFDRTYREKLQNIGFEKLGKLKYRQPYIAIIRNGQILEMSGDEKSPVSYTFETSDKVLVKVFSAGYKSGNKSSIEIDGKERSFNLRGFNMVILDNLSHKERGRIHMDTHMATERKLPLHLETLKAVLAHDPNPEHLTGDLRKLYDYMERIAKSTVAMQ